MVKTWSQLSGILVPVFVIPSIVNDAVLPHTVATATVRVAVVALLEMVLAALIFTSDVKAVAATRNVEGNSITSRPPTGMHVVAGKVTSTRPVSPAILLWGTNVGAARAPTLKIVLAPVPVSMGVPEMAVVTTIYALDVPAPTRQSSTGTNKTVLYLGW